MDEENELDWGDEGDIDQLDDSGDAVSLGSEPVDQLEEAGCGENIDDTQTSEEVKEPEMTQTASNSSMPTSIDSKASGSSGGREPLQAPTSPGKGRSRGYPSGPRRTGGSSKLSSLPVPPTHALPAKPVAASMSLKMSSFQSQHGASTSFLTEATSMTGSSLIGSSSGLSPVTANAKNDSTRAYDRLERDREDGRDRERNRDADRDDRRDRELPRERGQSSRRDRDRADGHDHDDERDRSSEYRNGDPSSSRGRGRFDSQPDDASLPPGWEIRQARSHTQPGTSSGAIYYYNRKTRVSTWTRPTNDTERATKPPTDAISRSKRSTDHYSPPGSPVRDTRDTSPRAYTTDSRQRGYSTITDSRREGREELALTRRDYSRNRDQTADRDQHNRFRPRGRSEDNSRSSSPYHGRRDRDKVSDDRTPPGRNRERRVQQNGEENNRSRGRRQDSYRLVSRSRSRSKSPVSSPYQDVSRDNEKKKPSVAASARSSNMEIDEGDRHWVAPDVKAISHSLHPPEHAEQSLEPVSPTIAQQVRKTAEVSSPVVDAHQPKQDTVKNKERDRRTKDRNMDSYIPDYREENKDREGNRGEPSGGRGRERNENKRKTRHSSRSRGQKHSSPSDSQQVIPQGDISASSYSNKSGRVSDQQAPEDSAVDRPHQIIMPIPHYGATQQNGHSTKYAAPPYNASASEEDDPDKYIPDEFVTDKAKGGGTSGVNGQRHPSGHAASMPPDPSQPSPRQRQKKAPLPSQDSRFREMTSSTSSSKTGRASKFSDAQAPVANDVHGSRGSTRESASATRSLQRTDSNTTDSQTGRSETPRGPRAMGTVSLPSGATSQGQAGTNDRGTRHSERNGGQPEGGRSGRSRGPRMTSGTNSIPVGVRKAPGATTQNGEDSNSLRRTPVISEPNTPLPHDERSVERQNASDPANRRQDSREVQDSESTAPPARHKRRWGPPKDESPPSKALEVEQDVRTDANEQHKQSALSIPSSQPIRIDRDRLFTDNGLSFVKKAEALSNPSNETAPTSPTFVPPPSAGLPPRPYGLPQKPVVTDVPPSPRRNRHPVAERASQGSGNRGRGGKERDEEHLQSHRQDDIAMRDLDEQLDHSVSRSTTSRGLSLLDRLNLTPVSQAQSLRDRVTVPSKRDRDEPSRENGRYSEEDGREDGDAGPNAKRPRKKNRKGRRGAGVTSVS